MPGLRAGRRELGAAAAFFPFVGLIIGCLVAGFDWAFKGLWESSISGVCSVAMLAILTRGLHLDGLADTADAVASGAERDRALAIMRDSTNGALGILAMFVVLMVKSVCAVQLSVNDSWEWFVLIPCFSRTGLVVLGAMSCYARETSGLGESFTGRSARKHLLVSLPTAFASAWALHGSAGMLVVCVVIASSLVVARWAGMRFGGVTGDILGAHVEIQEMFLFLVAAAM